MSRTANKLIQAAAGAGLDTGDDDFANVVLLLDGDGTSGDDNNTFTDSSTNGFTVTKTGSVVQGSFSPYGDNWSNYFDGSGDQIDVPDNNNLDFGTGLFTVELWFYIVSQNNNDGIISKGSGGGVGWQIVVSNTNNRLKFIRTSGNSSNPQITSGDVDLGKWYHLALTRDSSNNVRLFLNGTQEGTYTDSSSWNTSDKLKIGTNRGQNNDFNGYISNVRVIKGTALYTSAFTPPTSPLSAVTNTGLLTCQSNRFVDNSTTSASLTFGGTPKVTPFSPFKDDDARTLTTDGGSGYFDDSSNSYLQIADNSVFDATSSLCLEAWFYMTSAPGSGPSAHAVVGKWVSTTPGQRTIFIDIESTGLRVYADIQGASNPVLITEDGGAIPLYSWHHVAVTWDGSTYRAFLDGALEGSTSSSSAPVASSQVVRVGYNTNTHYFGGYITDARWVTDGGAIYTSAFTPPTSPLTAITNTELLLNFQDAGIYDRSGINNLDTVGNAQIDTAVKKYGTGSIQFDGSGDGLSSPETTSFGFGSGDFTIEAWAYLTTNGVFNNIVSAGVDVSNGYRLDISTSNNLRFLAHIGSWATVITGSTSLATGQWYHLAVTRNGNNFDLWVDGSSDATTVSNSGTITEPTTKIEVGAVTTNSLNRSFNGYLDDVRVTKGIARYTSSFTPPTEALPKF